MGAGRIYTGPCWLPGVAPPLLKVPVARALLTFAEGPPRERPGGTVTAWAALGERPSD